MVEALPLDGGCLLLFTPVEGRRRSRMKRAVGPYVYEVETADQLLGMARSLSRISAPLTGSSLYSFGKGYRLVLYPAAPLARGVGDLLGEFARQAGEGDAAAAFTAEHGRPIAVGDALARLCAASKKPLDKRKRRLSRTGCNAPAPLDRKRQTGRCPPPRRWLLPGPRQRRCPG